MPGLIILKLTLLLVQLVSTLSGLNQGDYNTPLLEYANQSGGYGEGRHGNYVNMWNNYLSKMPIIQKYLESLEHARQYR